MIKIYLRNILRFVILVLFQVLVINNIQITPLLNPLIYTLFILLLPFETPGWLLLIVAFVLGISVDIFTNTPGLHTSATVFISVFRPFVLRSIAPRDGYEAGTFPRLAFYGFNWFFRYTLILVFIHHLFFFILEAFGFSNFLFIISRTLLSSFVSVFLIVLSQYIIYRD